MNFLLVRLDDPENPGDGGVIIAIADVTRGLSLQIPKDSDNCRDPHYRVMRGYPGARVGDRVTYGRPS